MENPHSEIQVRSHYQPLVGVLAAFCVGILADRFLAWSPGVWVAAGIGGLICWCVLHTCRRTRAAAVVLLLMIGSLGGGWHHCRWSLFAADDLGTFAHSEPAPVCVEAIVVKGPRRVAPPPLDPMRVIPTGLKTRLLVEATRLRDGPSWRAVSGRAVLTVDGQLLGVHAGDRIRVFGTLSTPHPALNPGGFDQVEYYRGSRWLCRLWTTYPDCVTVVEEARYRGIGWWIERLRSDARRTLWQNLPQDRAELALAVLLGAREELDPEQTNVFVETGTVHLLAISGLHVGIVAGVLLGALRFLPLGRTSAFWIVIGWTVAYALLTDARPPAIRATILVVILCLARLKRRPASPWNSLACAGIIVLALNPADLFSTGVHLSFLAVATLICVSPRWFFGSRSEDPLDRLIEQSRGPVERGLRWSAAKVARVLVACTAVWLVTLPLVASRFHVVALGSVLLNAVLWIPMTTAVVSGFLMILSGWLLPAGVPLFAFVCNGSLRLLQAMIDTAHRLPGNPIWVAGWPDWWLIGFYVFLAIAVWTTMCGRRSRRWWWGVISIWLLVGGVATCRFAPRDRLICTMVSVGHGSAAIVEMPGGPVLLCDAGRMGSPISGARDIAGCLWDRRIRRIDAILLSHADADHFNAVPELLRRFEVGSVYAPPGAFDGNAGSVRALRKALDEHQVAIDSVVAGDRFRFGEAVVDVLHPAGEEYDGAENAGSLVLSVEYASRRIILPGDVEGKGLDAVLGSPARPCELLVAPHHGSLNTDAPGLAAWCRPQWVIISGYYEPRTEPVAQAYREAGAEVYYTGEVGAVTVTMSRENVAVVTHMAPAERHDMP